LPLSLEAGLTMLARDARADLHELLAVVAEPLGARDPVIYLVDFAHLTLMPLPVPIAGVIPVEEQIGTSLAGRAFTSGVPQSARRNGCYQVWVPLLEGTERTGVIGLTVDRIEDGLLEELALLGIFAGLAVATHASVSDLPHLRKRGQSMSLAATMQWELMPPLAAGTPYAAVAGALEPAYDIAGDAVDYAFNDREIDFAIFDGMGHGITSSLLTTLAVGAYRHARRQHVSVAAIHALVETAIADEYAGEAFVTGIIARLSLDSGVLTWSCAGHPPPLLLRERKVVTELSSEPNLPFGLGDETAIVSTLTLQAGDALVLYTDGVVEAQTPTGEQFGLTRLIDHLEREALSESTAQETLRRLVQAVLEHRLGDLRDDATMLMAQWLSPLATAPTYGGVPSQRVSALPR
jgi:hypothetical protein